MKKLHFAVAALLGVVGVISLALIGSDLRPWQNQPLDEPSRYLEITRQSQRVAARDPTLLVAVTISGGGARAAAFGYGVLRELQDTKFEWNGRQTNMLDSVDVIGGVSGGSIVAAYYAAFGSERLPSFEDEFLYRNFHNNLILQALHPVNLYRLTSPWFGRSHLLAERLDELFQGRTFGDVMARPRHPQLLISATDMAQGLGFEFTPDQFELLCSELASVPLSFAVAASASVPLLLSPLTLQNHSEVCRERGIPQRVPPSKGNDYRSRLYALQQLSYLDSALRPYIHLVDGSVADNLGIRRVLNRALADNGFRSSFQEVGIEPGGVRRVVLITVNAERNLGLQIDTDDDIPSSLEVMNTLRHTAISRTTLETQEFLTDLVEQWGDTLQAQANGIDIFAPDARIHAVKVNLRDVPLEESEREPLLHIPTTFSLGATEVAKLIEAGRSTLRHSAAYQALRHDLGAHTP